MNRNPVQNVFLTYCVDIGKISREHLALACQALLRSLEWWNNDFHLLVYTNFDFRRLRSASFNWDRVIVRDFTRPLGADKWHDLNLSRGAAALAVARELGTGPIWIDLDTIVCRNVDHLRHYDGFFVMKGTASQRKMTINSSCVIPECDDIQGNIWKAPEAMLEEAVRRWHDEREKPRFDLQGTWNLMYHKYAHRRGMPILGRDLDRSTVNGLEIANRDEVCHTHFSMLANTLFFDKDSKVRSTRFPGRTVQFLSFTFKQWVDSVDTFDLDQFVCCRTRQFFEHLLE